MNELGLWTRNSSINFTQSLNNAVTAVITILLVHRCRNATNVPNCLWRVVPRIVAKFDQLLEKTCSLSLQGQKIKLPCTCHQGENGAVEV